MMSWCRENCTAVWSVDLWQHRAWDDPGRGDSTETAYQFRFHSDLDAMAFKLKFS